MYQNCFFAKLVAEHQKRKKSGDTAHWQLVPIITLFGLSDTHDPASLSDTWALQDVCGQCRREIISPSADKLVGAQMRQPLL